MAEEAEGIRVGTASRGGSKTQDRKCGIVLDVSGGNKSTWSPSAKLAVMCSDRFWARNLSKRPWSQLKQR